MVKRIDKVSNRLETPRQRVAKRGPSGSGRPSLRPVSGCQKLIAIASVFALGAAGVVLPSAPSEAATAATSGLTITKQGGLYKNGECVMGEGLDEAGFMWAAPGTAICYVYTIRNSSSTTATSVSFSDQFQGAWANGQPALSNASTPTVSGDGVGAFCTGSSASNYYNCQASSLPGGGTMTVLIHGIVNPGLANSTTAAECGYSMSGPPQGLPGFQNQAGTIADWGYGYGKWVCGNQTWITNEVGLTAQGVPILVSNASQSIGVGGTATTPEADVRLTKCVGAGSIPAGTCPTTNSVNPGQAIVWQITATNYGPADAQNVVVTDTVPAGVTVNSAQNCQPPAGVTLPATGPLTLTCSTKANGGFALQANSTPGLAGGQQTFTIGAIVNSDFTGTLTNSATATNVTNPVTNDPDTDNNIATTETTVPANLEYGLYIHKHADRQKLPADDGIAVPYTLHVGNAMGGTAHDVTITDTLPDGMEFTNPPFAITQGDPSNVHCSVTSQTLTCTVNALLVGTNNEVVLQLNTQSTTNLAAIGAPVINTATVHADCPTGQNSCGINDGTTSWPLSDKPAADAYIKKSINNISTGALVYAGSTAELNFTVGVKPGGTDEDGVVAVAPLVTDTLPAGMTFAGGATIAVPNGQTNSQTYGLSTGDCTTDPTTLKPPITNSTLPAPSTLYCLLDKNMAQGDAVNINVPVKIGDVAGGTELVNKATVQNTSDGFEPGNPDSGSMTHVNLGNNVDVSTATVFSEVNLVAGLHYSQLDSSGLQCDQNSNNRTDADYTGPGSSREVTVDITNIGNATAPYPGFSLQRATGAAPDFSKMQVTPGVLDANGNFTATGASVSADSIGGQCVIMSMSIACGFPNSSVAAGQTFRVTYPLTLLPSDQPNTSPESDVTVWNGAWIPDADWDDNITSNNINIGSAVTNMCLTKTPYNPAFNPASDAENPDDAHPAFWQDGGFGYTITVAPPMGGVSADAANGVVTDILPVGLYPIDASTDAGSCSIVGPVDDNGDLLPAGTAPTTQTSDNSSAPGPYTATGPRYKVTCQLLPGGGNTPASTGAPDPKATINVWGDVLPNTVNAYWTDNLANGINWAEQVPNTATFDYNAIGSTVPQHTSATALVDLIQRVPNFTITKTPVTSMLENGVNYSDPNTPVYWDITVTNTGPVGASNPTITDRMNTDGQANITGATVIDSSLAEGATCDNMNTDTNIGALPCRATGLAVGGHITVRVYGTIGDLPGSTEVQNTAMVQSDTPGSVTAGGLIVILPVADLWTVKAAPEAAQPGAGIMPDSQQLSWEILAGTYGPTTVPDAVVTDNIPAGVTVTSATWAGGNCTAADSAGKAVDLPAAGPLTLSCAVGNMALGTAPIPITINANVALTYIGDLVNTSDIGPGPSNIPDYPGGGTPNQFTTHTNVNAEADLWLTKTGPTQAVTPGHPFQWLLKAGNNGPSTVTDAEITDSVPAGSIVTAAPTFTNPDGSIGTCTSSTGSFPATGEFTLTCPVGALADGDEVDITIDATVDPSFTGDNLHNTATIKSPTVPQTPTTSDPKGTPPTDDSNTPVGSPDSSIWIEKNGPDEGTVVAGNQIKWIIKVGNDGPSTASDVKVTDAVPAGITDVSVSPSGSCTVDGSNVSCSLGDIGPGGEVDVTVSGTVDPSVPDHTELDNRATATTPTEPDSPQTSDPHPIIVHQKASLVLQKTATPEVEPGGQIVYYLNLANTGPSDVTDAKITDTLPYGVDGDTAQVVEGPCQGSVKDLPGCLIALKVNQNVQLKIEVNALNEPEVEPGDTLWNEAVAESAYSSPSVAKAETVISEPPVEPTPPTPPAAPSGTIPAPPGQVTPPTNPGSPAEPPAPSIPEAPATPTPAPKAPWTPAPLPPTSPIAYLPIPAPLDIVGRNPKQQVRIPAPLDLTLRELTRTGIDNRWFTFGSGLLVVGLGLALISKRRTAR